MTSTTPVMYRGSLWSPLAETNQFGISTLTLAGLPRRAFTDDELRSATSLVEHFVDAANVQPIPSFADLVRSKLASGESWLGSTRKAQQALLAWFLLAEDPQRRLVVRDVSPLMHQLSLVEHVLADKDLTRVLIGDEVGLGKTVEAGLITQRLLASQTDIRVLYLAPARLVRNVASEYRRLGIDARTWVSGSESDARLESDRVVIASIHKAVYESNSKRLLAAGPWDLLIADECHHLSDWAQGGGSPNAGYKLVRDLVGGQRPERGRLLLMSGTPHQGNQTRFENILELLRKPDEQSDDVAGRVIYRTKESVRDWHGRPLFPKRDVRQPRLAHLDAPWMEWYTQVGDLYDGSSVSSSQAGSARAGGWAKGQALQWAASSVEAGLGFLVRLAIRRLRWNASQPQLAEALASLRPYRGGSAQEPISSLFQRLVQQIGNIESQEDAEETEHLEPVWQPDEAALADLLHRGTQLKQLNADAEKWRVMGDILVEADGEKVVLFCQPVETVGVVARRIEAQFGTRPSIIIGGQSEDERTIEIARFRDPNGPQFIVSSRAGGEGLNLQISRRLLHLDIPWNPMELEQRVGRVHRFGSRQTIIVDTIVVPGSREADAYRIARDKLRLIAGQLAPDTFELLFSRVMNLVPPEELANIFGTTQPWSTGDETDIRIASIVRSGYEKLSRFTDQYAEGALRLRDLNTGAADWPDLREFLTRACGAVPEADGTKPIFSLEDDDIVSGEARVQTLRVFDKRFVCDETDGLPCHDADGDILPRLGMSSRELTLKIREKLADATESAVGAVKLDRELFDNKTMTDCLLFFVALQQVSFSGNSAEEHGLELRGFLMEASDRPSELPHQLMIKIIRHVCLAERQTRPSGDRCSVSSIESGYRDILQSVRNGAQATAGRRPTAVWPVGCFYATLA